MLLVTDPANREIRGEMIRLLEDVARMDYASTTYRQTPLVVNVQMGGMTEQIYANELSDIQREAISYRAGKYCAEVVADSLCEALQSDLRNCGNYNRGGEVYA